MKFYIGASFKNCNLVNQISQDLINQGWVHTYNWANEIVEEETEEDLIRFTKLEKDGIANADVIIIFLPAGRGTHVELGYALAKNKQIFLYSTDGEDFNVKDTVNFYFDTNITRVTGDIEELKKKVLEKRR